MSIISSVRPPISIAVIAQRFPDGKGDVATGSDIAALARRLFPQIEVVFSYVDIPRGTVYDTIFDYSTAPAITEQDQKTWGITPIQTVNNRIGRREFKFIVMNSTADDKMIPRNILGSGVPILKFREYGFEWDGDQQLCRPPVYRLGIAKEEHGVIFPFNFYQKYIQINDWIKLRTATAPIKAEASDLVMEYLGYADDRPLSRLRFLEKLPPRLLETILGPRLHVSFEKAIETFNTSSRLYYGYGHTPIMCCFIHALCTPFDEKDSANITICFLNSLPRESDLTQDFNRPFEKTLNSIKLIEDGFKTVSISYQDKEDGLIKRYITLDLPSSKGTRTLTLIFHPLPPSQAHLLARSCERQTFSTGDSSFLKTLALDQFSAHEVRVHKKDFINSFIKLTSTKSQALSKLLFTSFYGDEANYKEFAHGGTVNPVKLKVGMWFHFRQMRNPELQRKFAEVVQHIAEKKDLSLALPRIFKPYIDK